MLLLYESSINVLHLNEVYQLWKILMSLKDCLIHCMCNC